MNNIPMLVVGVVGVILIIAVTYALVCLLTWIICSAFGLPWNWLIALGVYAVCVLVRWCFSAAKSN